MTNQSVGRLLSPAIDFDALDHRIHPFQALSGDSGFPVASISADVDTIRRRPYPFVSSLSVLQFWTLSAWQKARIDISAGAGIDRPSNVGGFLIFCPDRGTQFRFGLIHSKSLAIDAYAEKHMNEHTLGVGLRPDDDNVSRAMISWSGVLVPDLTTARFEVFHSPYGLGHACSIISTPNGANGFRLKFSMYKVKKLNPVPLLAMSQAISSWQRIYVRLKTDSVEVGVATRPQECLDINVGMLSDFHKGLAISLRFQYRFFSVTAPIWISHDPRDLHAVVTCLVIPATLWGLWNSIPLFASRRQKLQEERRAAAHRSLSLKIAHLRQRRQFALEQQEAMRHEAEVRHRAELEKNGLVIENGVFYIEDVDSVKASRAKSRGAEFSSELDVTTPLQFWVEGSRLEITSAPKRSMLGFYCPFAPGVEKAQPKLRVRYSYQGDAYSCVVSECQPLKLPDARHTCCL